MRKRILATLLSVVMILSMLPTALAEGPEPTDGQLPEAECICEAACTEEDFNELCPVCGTDYTQCGYIDPAPADDGEVFAACTKTEGCTLAEGHEGDCVLPDGGENGDDNAPESSAAAKQAEALIAALPDAEDVTLDHAADVFAAQAAYDALSEEDRAAVDAALAEKLAALLSAVQALVDEQNQMTAPIPDELPTENATCTYVSTDGTVQSESPVTLSEAVEALNEAGGGTITVVSSGLAGANNILISAEITIIAQEGNPVTVTAMPMETEDSMFELDTLSSVTTGTSVLTLGQDNMSKGLLTFDGAKQANTTIVSNYYGTGSETSPHGVVLRDGIVLTGCTVSTIGEPKSRTLPKVTMYGGQITGNYGKYAISGVPFVMEGGEIFGNVSEVATVSSVYMGRTLTIGGTAYIHDNEAGDVGGADSWGTLILQGNAKIANCTATNEDGVGGIHGYGNDGVTIKDNALIDSCQGKFVGGCYSQRGDVSMTDQATIQNCTATGASWNAVSGFYPTGGLIGTENISIGQDAKVLNCSGAFTGGVLSSHVNNAVYNEARTVTIEGTISGNKGAFGGGIGSLDRGNLTIKESAVISNNEASSAGGGIVLLNQKLTATSGTISESQKITLTVEGGTISGNRAPSGGGIYVAGAAEVLDIFSAYISAGRTPIPCKVNLQGGTITGNTATACGGGMFLGWDVDATIQGVVNIAGNTDDTGAASDLYLRQNPEMAVTDPGVSNSIKGLEDFIAATTADYIEKAIIPQLQEQIGKLSDEELKEALVSLGVIQAKDEVERDELEDLYFETIRDIYSVTYPIQAIDQLINQYRQYYDFVPSFEEFSALHKGLYKAYFEVYVRLEIANADQEDIDRAALACGLISSGESYTGPMDELMEALVELNMKNQYQGLDENAYNGFWTSPVSGAALPYDARLKVAGTLAGSNIRVNVENPQKWRVIADGKGEYTITDDDFAVFQSNDAGYYIIRSESDSNLLILMPEEVTVILTPQDMTAYTGGDSISDDPFPSVRYAITGVESTAIPDLEFTVDGNTCKPEQAGSYWLLSGVENTFTPVVSQKTRAAGEYENDGLAGEYTIGVENDDTLTVKGADDKQYAVKVADGEEAGILTVRNVSDPNAVLEDKMDIAQEVVSSESQVDTSKGAVAVIENGATYYTNGKKANLGVLGTSSAAPTSGEQIALLFAN
ncbi:autotransporter outer membrane beta-barrel domain-containing protein, partial [Agathobaculum sp. TL06]